MLSPFLFHFFTQPFLCVYNKWVQGLLSATVQQGCHTDSEVKGFATRLTLLTKPFTSKSAWHPRNVPLVSLSKGQ